MCSVVKLGEGVLVLYPFHQQGLPAECPEGMTSCSQQRSPELMVFLEKQSDIHRLVSSTVQHNLAYRAFAKGLISETNKTTITDPLNRLTANERTNLFINELEARIKTDPTALTKFLNMLRESDAAYFSTLIRTISEFCPWLNVYIDKHSCTCRCTIIHVI